MYDLIVVGAGPAGSSTAIAATKAGLYVLLLEKESFPRYKPCGGSLSNKVFSILDFSIPDELCERTINCARVHFRRKIVEGQGQKGDPLFTLITRSAFDDFLLQKAIEGGCNTATMKVMGYSQKDDHVQVITKRKKFKSKFLVIASGCQSPLKGGIQERETRDRYGISVVTEVPEDEEKIQKRLGNSVDLYFDAANAGYGWVFPHKGYCSVGIWGQASQLNNLRSSMQNFLLRLGFNGNYRLHGHIIPLGGISRVVGKGRVLLAGDSAGFVDPITGEGIYYAIRSGQIAAEAIINQDLADVARTYDDMCKKDFAEDLGNAYRLQHLLNCRHDICYGGLIERDDAISNYL